ncbi:hypothetical protein VaNZ11_015365 [Volvox africanus]|uniref:Uncharacterized protein n=1 Tax=Volvox africanus TaxID=51714 RepID=A0ABQ5SKL9_9CHLO|nr:hypothetical protein VaNZ11_015365 [Volvox africanus]
MSLSSTHRRSVLPLQVPVDAFWRQPAAMRGLPRETRLRLLFDAAVLTRISVGCWLELYGTWRQSTVVREEIGSQMEAALVAGSHLTEESCKRGQVGKNRNRVDG